MDTLQKKAGIRMVITDNNDPDGVGTFVRWRVAFYVAGGDDCVENFFYLFDEFLVWKSKQIDKTVQAFVVGASVFVCDYL